MAEERSSSSGVEEPDMLSSESNDGDSTEGGADVSIFPAPKRSRTSRVFYHPYLSAKEGLSPRRRRKGTPRRSPSV